MFHPINPATGKMNAQMWQFANYDAIRGEENMKSFVVGSQKIQDELMSACYAFKDNEVQLDAAGVVVESEDMVDLDLE